jgi:hypothetical protein
MVQNADQGRRVELVVQRKVIDSTKDHLRPVKEPTFLKARDGKVHHGLGRIYRRELPAPLQCSCGHHLLRTPSGARDQNPRGLPGPESGCQDAAIKASVKNAAGRDASPNGAACDTNVPIYSRAVT